MSHFVDQILDTIKSEGISSSHKCNTHGRNLLNEERYKTLIQKMQLSKDILLYLYITLISIVTFFKWTKYKALFSHYSPYVFFLSLHKTYIALYLLFELFREYIRWLPDKWIVVLLEVVINLYMLISVAFFSRNVSTSLKASLPFDIAEKKNNQRQTPFNMNLCNTCKLGIFCSKQLTNVALLQKFWFSITSSHVLQCKPWSQSSFGKTPCLKQFGCHFFGWDRT